MRILSGIVTLITNSETRDDNNNGVITNSEMRDKPHKIRHCEIYGYSADTNIVSAS